MVSFSAALFFGILGICNLFGNMKDHIPKKEVEEEEDEPIIPEEP